MQQEPHSAEARSIPGWLVAARLPNEAKAALTLVMPFRVKGAQPGQWPQLAAA